MRASEQKGFGQMLCESGDGKKQAIYIQQEVDMQKNYKFKYQSSKKSQEAITRFNYCLQQMVPDLFQAWDTPDSFQHIKIASVTAPNQVAYFYTYNQSELDCLFDQESILHSMKATYLQKKNENDSVLRVNDKSFQKMSVLGGSLIGANWEANEVLDFVLNKQESKQNGQKKYELYIIHHCHSQMSANSIKWLNFVEKYEFSESVIKYQVIASCAEDASYFSWSTNKSYFKFFIESHFKINQIQGTMMQYQDRIKEKIKVSGDPAFSDQINLASQIPSQFMKGFYSLKKQFGDQNIKHIARFYIAREYNFQETKKSIQNYLQWKKQLVSKYTWEDFQQFHRMNMFYFLGEDHMARPVILNKAKNVKVDEMDLDKYCIYYMYYMEVFLPSKMRGNVSQINIIADVEDIGANNFKLAVTRRNISDGSTYCAQRQYKFFSVNVNMFAYYCWKFIKPLLPKRTVQKIFIGGNDMKEITESLLLQMPIETIPRYLGGQNPLI